MNAKDFPFGLIVVSTRNPVPLKQIKIFADVDNFSSRVLYTQTYFNEGDVMLECEYFFPISSTACFDHFSAKYQNKVIKGTIKEKNKAKEEYKSNVSDGKTVAYAEINKETQDIMKVMVGNIPPNCEVEIQFSFIERIEISMNQFYKFALYSTITRRYSSTRHNQDVTTLSQYPYIHQSDPNAYPWEVEIHVNTGYQITFLKSLTHPDIEISFKNESDSQNSAVIKFPQGKYVPSKDFVLLFADEKLASPSAHISKYDDGYFALLQFMPRMNSLSMDDAFRAALENKDPGENLDITNAKGEFIFLLDRSGSMDSRIRKARQALAYFLKSLPADCYFNIISFGSEFYPLNFDESIKASEESLENALDVLSGYEADMGGTEILESLKYVAKMPQKQGYPRTVFLLTDGAVDNTNQVLTFIQSNRDKMRVFTIGIGDGCSTELIKNGAKAGLGVYEFVSDREDVAAKVIYLLKNAITPFITDFRLSLHDKEMAAYIIPDPNSIQYIIPNQFVEFLIIYNKQANKETSVNFTYYNGIELKEETQSIVFDLMKADSNDEIMKISIKKFLNSLKERLCLEGKGYNQLDDAIKQDVKNQLINMSLKYQILTDQTAFICTIDEGNDTSKQIPTQKVLVPQIALQDSQSNSRDNSEDEFDPKYICDEDDMEEELASMKQNPYSALKEENEFDNYSCSLFDDDDGTCSYDAPTLSSIARKASAPERKRAQKKDKIKEKEKEEEESKEPKILQKSKPNKNSLDAVVVKQKLSGYWELNPEICSLLSLNTEDVKANIPQVLGQINEKDKIWFTILVLYWIESNFSSYNSSWELIHKKGVQWLAGKNINYSEHIDSAKTFLLNQLI